MALQLGIACRRKIPLHKLFLRSLLNNAERVLLCTGEKIWPLFKDFPCFPSNSELNLHFASAKIFGAHSHENHWEKKTS